MHAFFRSLFAFFLSAGGLLLAALDSSLFFYLPFANDAAVIILAARTPRLFWLYSLMATAGSVIGSSVTYAIGRALGERGLRHLISSARLRYIKRKVRQKGAIALAVPAVVPPPFPFTPFVLGSGALEVHQGGFLVTLGVSRLFRFVIEAVLAVRYGRQIIHWLESPAFETVVGMFMVVAFAGTSYSIVRLVKASRQRPERRRRAHRSAA